MKFKHSRRYDHSKIKCSGQYRKARSGILQLAMVRHKHTAHNSLYVGDRSEDKEAARRAGVPFQWAWDWIEQHQEAIAPLTNLNFLVQQPALALKN